MDNKNLSLINTILDKLDSYDLSPTYSIDYDEDEKLTTAVIETTDNNKGSILITLELETGKIVYSHTNKNHKLTYGVIHSLDNFDLKLSISE